MSPLAAVAALTGLVLVSSLAYVVAARRAGRVRAVGVGRVTAAELGLDGPFGDRATLVQFSTRYCATCPGTARLLGAIAADRPGVVHREVDLTSRPELADRFSVLQTPTTLVVAGDRIRARVGGAPDRSALVRELDAVLEGT